MSDNARENESSSDTTVIDPPPKVRVKQRPQNARPKGNEPTGDPPTQPPYAVVLLNDDDHTYDYVIETLCRVCHHTTERAFLLAQQIDHTGRAVVWSGTLELAELKRDQI